MFIAAGGLGALAVSCSHVPQTGVASRKAKATVRAASASVKLTDDNMSELKSQTKVFSRPWEGEFLASALVIEAEERICLVSFDAIIPPLAVTRAAAKGINLATGIPEDHILICGTHTHSGPSTADFPGSQPNKEFLRRLEEGSILAATRASAAAQSSGAVEILFGKSQEATVGRNSRLLLKDDSVGWSGYEEKDTVRPTGPYDPDLYVLAMRRADGTFAGLAFNHSVHNIGRLRADCMSPCFYGLTAQQTGKQHNTTTLFLPGAFGSTHNITYKNSGVPPEECVHRVTAAIEEALGRVEPALPGPVRVLNRTFTYRIRRFDEAREAATVKYYMEKYVSRDGTQEYFKNMRAGMASHQNEECSTRLQVIRLGDIVFVGIPGEMFAQLGLELRRRSPFRHTCIIGLANEEIGYIPDRKAYEDGGYQTWVGWHSRLAPGTGEAMIDEAVDMLNELYNAAPPKR